MAELDPEFDAVEGVLNEGEAAYEAEQEANAAREAANNEAATRLNYADMPEQKPLLHTSLHEPYDFDMEAITNDDNDYGFPQRSAYDNASTFVSNQASRALDAVRGLYQNSSDAMMAALQTEPEEIIGASRAGPYRATTGSFWKTQGQFAMANQTIQSYNSENAWNRNR